MPMIQDPTRVIATPSKATRLVKGYVKIHRPVLISGVPGIGKSQIVQQISQALDMRLYDGLRASMLDAVDVRGMPVPDVQANLTRWIPPAFFPRRDPVTGLGVDGPALVFLDELGRGQPIVQNALMSFTLERKSGEYLLPDDAAVVAATNDVKDGGGVYQIVAALNNRFSHVELTVDNRDWINWALDYDIHPAVVAFMQMRPKLLSVIERGSAPANAVTADRNPSGLPLDYIYFDPKVKAYPTPRTWADVSTILKENVFDGDPEVETLALQGTVGMEAGSQIAAFLPIYRTMQTSIPYIIQHPTTADVPSSDQVSESYVIASALAMNANERNWENIVTYLDRMRGDLASFAMIDATHKHPELRQTNTYIRWAQKHHLT